MTIGMLVGPPWPAAAIRLVSVLEESPWRYTAGWRCRFIRGWRFRAEVTFSPGQRIRIEGTDAERVSNLMLDVVMARIADEAEQP